MVGITEMIKKEESLIKEMELGVNTLNKKIQVYQEGIQHCQQAGQEKLKTILGAEGAIKALKDVLRKIAEKENAKITPKTIDKKKEVK